MYQFSRVVWVPLAATLLGTVGEFNRIQTLAYRLTDSCAVLGSRAVHDLTGLSMPWTGTMNAPGLAYIAIALAFNLILSVLMIVPVVKANRRLLQICVDHEARILYASVISTLCVSAAVYIIVTVIKLVAVALDASLASTLLPLLGQMQVRQVNLYVVYQPRDQSFASGPPKSNDHRKRCGRAISTVGSINYHHP